MLDPAILPTDFRERIERWRCGSGTFRMNVALSELPQFSCLPGRTPGDHHTAGIILAPTLAYMEQAYFDARAQGWSRRPIIELVIPSTLDDTLAPPGAHVASLFCQHVAPRLPDGRSWDAHREAVADLMIDTVSAYAPNFKRAVLGRQILSPLDLERTFGLSRGRHLPRRAQSRSDVLGPANVGSRALPGPAAGSVHVRLRHAPGRWRHGRAGPQCRARDSRRPQGPAIGRTRLRTASLVSGTAGGPRERRRLLRPSR
ncbi:FAD dependent oxidoreductase [mine drainage metagenome]|uniref:FAD dependent oxidoreductase n=1 Tax=mine drainage metagenome TaxID=410659 RepID=T1BNI5_9ZZZZ